jgi:hypothetical protein
MEHPLKFKRKILTNSTSGYGLQDITPSNCYVLQPPSDTLVTISQLFSRCEGQLSRMNINSSAATAATTTTTATTNTTTTTANISTTATTNTTTTTTTTTNNNNKFAVCRNSGAMFVTVCLIHSVMSFDRLRFILCSKLTSNLRMDLMLRIDSADVNHIVLESELTGEK